MRKLKELFKMLFTIKHKKNGRLDKIHGENEAEVMEIFKISGQEIEIVGREEPPTSSIMKRGNPGNPGSATDGSDPMVRASLMVEQMTGVTPQGPPQERHSNPPPPPPPLEFEADGAKFRVEGATVFKKTWVEITDSPDFKVEDGKIFNLQWVKIK